MYNPEFRYLIAEDNGEPMIPFADGYVFAAIIVCGVSLLIVVGGIITAFTLTSLIVIPLRHLLEYLWELFWNSLTPGNQWLDIAIITTSIVPFIVLFRTIEGISDDLDRSFKKLKKEIAERNEKITGLELEIVKLKERIQETKIQETKIQETKIQETKIQETNKVVGDKVVYKNEVADDKVVYKNEVADDKVVYKNEVADDKEVDKQILATWFENCLPAKTMN